MFALIFLLALNVHFNQLHGFEYNFTISVSTTTNLNIWFSFDVNNGNQSPWHYIGALTAGNDSFTMDTATQVVGTSTMGQVHRFYFGSYGNINAQPSQVDRIEFHYNGGIENNNIWDGSGTNQSYNFTCKTDSTDCCVVRFRTNFDDISSESTSSPCSDSDTFNFITNREGIIPSIEPTNDPSIIPTIVPTIIPTTIPTGLPSKYTFLFLCFNTYINLNCVLYITTRLKQIACGILFFMILVI